MPYFTHVVCTEVYPDVFEPGSQGVVVFMYSNHLFMHLFIEQYA